MNNNASGNTTPPVISSTPEQQSVIPFTPTSVPPITTYVQSVGNSSGKSGKNKVFVVIILVVLALLLIVGAGLAVLKKKPAGTGVAPSVLQKVITTDLTRYDKDTDNDGYPDFIETQIGLDPNVSEYTSCMKGGCGESDQVNTPAKKHNVLIILDGSGSMALGGTPNRMEIAKQAIKTYVAKASVNTRIGFMIYGHKGSNSASDKAVSCKSAEVKLGIGSVNPQSIDTELTTIRPVGWTPMGFALQQATTAFAGKEGENNEIILLSDGEESCDSNPTLHAATLKNSAQKIIINVIGFAVDASAQTQLNQISTSGGGTFSSANNLTELDRKFNDLYENGLKLYAELKCSTQNVEAFRACYNSSFNKVINWIQKQKLLLYDKKITQDEYNKLDSLSTAIYKQQKEITTSETQKVIDRY